MKKGGDEEEEEEEEVGSSCAWPWDCGSPLYDSYELASLAHLLERHTMALPYLYEGSPSRLNQGRVMNTEAAGLHDHQAGFMITKFARNGMWKRARKYLRSGFYSFCSSVGLRKNKGTLKLKPNAL